MLADGKVFATIAVSDLAAAKKFYGDTLGLPVAYENPGGVAYESGGSHVFVYESQFAGTNEATCASWQVDDVAATVEELKAKGITFEHYDLPDTTWDGDVASWGDQGNGAWFKDPDGNILSINDEMA